MRSIVLIAVLVVLAAATGCQKEEIRPTCSPQASGSVATETTGLRSTSADGETGSEGTTTTVSGGGTGSGQTGGGITDPNSDPSGDKKKKR